MRRIIHRLFPWLDVRIESKNLPINAISGKFIIPKGLTFVDADTADSIISFWVIRPEVQDDVLRFVGLMPNGYTGVSGPYWEGEKSGRMFTAHFLVEDLKDARISLDEVEVLENDGEGTPVEVAVRADPAVVFQGSSSSEPAIFFPKKNTSRSSILIALLVCFFILGCIVYRRCRM